MGRCLESASSVLFLEKYTHSFERACLLLERLSSPPPPKKKKKKKKLEASQLFQFNVPLRLFSTNETDQSVSGEKTDEIQETWHTCKQNLARLECAQCWARTLTRLNDGIKRGNEISALHNSATGAVNSCVECIVYRSDTIVIASGQS